MSDKVRDLERVRTEAASKAINNCVKKLVKEFKKFDLKPPKARPAKKFESTISQLHTKIRKLEKKRKKS